MNKTKLNISNNPHISICKYDGTRSEYGIRMCVYHINILIELFIRNYYV